MRRRRTPESSAVQNITKLVKLGHDANARKSIAKVIYVSALRETENKIFSRSF